MRVCYTIFNLANPIPLPIVIMYNLCSVSTRVYLVKPFFFSARDFDQRFIHWIGLFLFFEQLDPGL